MVASIVTELELLEQKLSLNRWSIQNYPELTAEANLDDCFEHFVTNVLKVDAYNDLLYGLIGHAEIDKNCPLHFIVTLTEPANASLKKILYAPIATNPLHIHNKREGTNIQVVCIRGENESMYIRRGEELSKHLTEKHGVQNRLSGNDGGIRIGDRWYKQSQLEKKFPSYVEDFVFSFRISTGRMLTPKELAMLESLRKYESELSFNKWVITNFPAVGQEIAETAYARFLNNILQVPHDSPIHEKSQAVSIVYRKNSKPIINVYVDKAFAELFKSKITEPEGPLHKFNLRQTPDSKVIVYVNRTLQEDRYIKRSESIATFLLDEYKIAVKVSGNDGRIKYEGQWYSQSELYLHLQDELKDFDFTLDLARISFSEAADIQLTAEDIEAFEDGLRFNKWEITKFPMRAGEKEFDSFKRFCKIVLKVKNDNPLLSIPISNVSGRYENRKCVALKVQIDEPTSMIWKELVYAANGAITHYNKMPKRRYEEKVLVCSDLSLQEKNYVMRSCAIEDHILTTFEKEIRVSRNDGNIFYLGKWQNQSTFQRRYPELLEGFQYDLNSLDAVLNAHATNYSFDNYLSMYFWKDAASYCVNASKSIKLSELPHKFKQMIAIDLFKSMQVYGCLKKKMLLIKKIIDEDRRSSFTLVNNNNRNGINATKGYLVNNEKEFCIMINLIDIELRDRGCRPLPIIDRDIVDVIGTCYARMSTNDSPSVDSELDKLLNNEWTPFVETLRFDLSRARQIHDNAVDNKNLAFPAPISAVAHFRKHFPELITEWQTWNRQIDHNRERDLNTYLITIPKNLRRHKCPEGKKSGTDYEYYRAVQPNYCISYGNSVWKLPSPKIDKHCSPNEFRDFALFCSANDDFESKLFGDKKDEKELNKAFEALCSGKSYEIVKNKDRIVFSRADTYVYMILKHIKKETTDRLQIYSIYRNDVELSADALADHVKRLENGANRFVNANTLAA